MNLIQNPPDWLAKLNPEQREAVATTEGPLLVLSGAGTGKTRVLTSKIAYILWKGLAKPWEILAVTFTNKAANEMKSRVRGLVGEEADGLWIGTFHSIGLRILRKYAEATGLKPNFLIFDEGDQRILVKKAMEEELKIDTKLWPPTAALEAIQRLKDKGFRFDDGNIGLADAGGVGGRLLDIYRRYQARLAENNAADFGDLLLHPLTLFGKNPAVLEEFQRKFRYILVDEYQDTNAAQHKLLRLLAARHGNIACVGDDDQSIYSWRGADIENILRFERDFPGAKIIRLETNYRSTPHILAAASHLISKNRDRLGKELRPQPGLAEGESMKVRVQGVYNGDEEARQVVEEIEYFERNGTPLSEIAVLVRAGYQTRAFEEKLIRGGIPYKIVGGLKFYERQEIKDVIAHLRLLAYPQDDLSFERIINVPRRGVGDRTLGAIAEFARKNRIPMIEAVRRMITAGKIGGKTGEALKKFSDDFARWRAIYNGEGDLLGDTGRVAEHSQLAQLVLKESGYIEMWQNSKKVEAEAKLQNINEFLGILKSDFESISEFLEYVTLFAESNATGSQAADGGYVSLMTLHAAKGLEFDVVFLPGWETGIFPNERAAQEAGGSLEEERRLAYVGLTRAKKAVFIFYAGSRLVFGQWQQNMPSTFLFDLPNENVEHTSFSNAYNGG